MNQEVYSIIHQEIEDINRQWVRDEITNDEFIRRKKKICYLYVDYKEELIAAARLSRLCIANGLDIGGCVGLSCDSCHEKIYVRLANRINTVITERG